MSISFSGGLRPHKAPSDGHDPLAKRPVGASGLLGGQSPPKFDMLGYKLNTIKYALEEINSEDVIAFAKIKQRMMSTEGKEGEKGNPQDNVGESQPGGVPQNRSETGKSEPKRDPEDESEENSEVEEDAEVVTRKDGNPMDEKTRYLTNLRTKLGFKVGSQECADEFINRLLSQEDTPSTVINLFKFYYYYKYKCNPNEEKVRNLPPAPDNFETMYQISNDFDETKDISSYIQTVSNTFNDELLVDHQKEGCSPLPQKGEKGHDLYPFYRSGMFFSKTSDYFIVMVKQHLTTFENGDYKEVQNPKRFTPPETLTLTVGEKSQKFTLVSFVIHLGQETGRGHYIAVGRVKHKHNNRKTWVKYDDRLYSPTTLKGLNKTTKDGTLILPKVLMMLYAKGADFAPLISEVSGDDPEFKNEGNTCYANAVVQMLRHCPGIAQLAGTSPNLPSNAELYEAFQIKS